MNNATYVTHHYYPTKNKMMKTYRAARSSTTACSNF